MPQGTAYPTTKSALTTRFQALSGLNGVAVSYRAPDKAEEIQGPSGAWEAVFFDDAEGELDNVILCAGDLHFDEAFDLTMVVQVLRPEESDTSQQDAEERVGEILYLLLGDIAAQATWDLAALDLDVFDYWRVLPASQRWAPGFLPSGAGHGARCELGLRVEARRSFS